MSRLHGLDVLLRQPIGIAMMIARLVDYEATWLQPSDPSGHYTLGIPKVAEPSEASMVCHNCEVSAGQVILE